MVFVVLWSISYSKRTHTVQLSMGVCTLQKGIDEAWFTIYLFLVRPLIEILSVIVYIPVMILYVGR